MTNVELDIITLDISECIDSFLQYCPAASKREAVSNAMDYVKEHNTKLTKAEITQLYRDAERIFADKSRTKSR